MLFHRVIKVDHLQVVLYVREEDDGYVNVLANVSIQTLHPRHLIFYAADENVSLFKGFILIFLWKIIKSICFLVDETKWSGKQCSPKTVKK